MARNTKSKKSVIKNQRQDWERKARRVYKEGLAFFKEGFHGLEIMAEKTLEVSRLRIANQKTMLKIRQLFSDLGHRVYDEALSRRSLLTGLSRDAMALIERIRGLQKDVEGNNEVLRHATAVSNQQSTKSSVPRRKKAAKK